jgi:hypothetical protein
MRLADALRLAALIGLLTALAPLACGADPEKRGAASPVAPDPVLDWNATAAQIIVGPNGANKPPPLGLIDFAMVHTAIYDAVNSIDGFPYDVYAIGADVARPASSYAAAAQAAHDVLLALYPSQLSVLDAALAASLSYVEDGVAKTNGIVVGSQVAAAIVQLRKDDGRNNISGFTTSGGDGVWVPTPPGFLPAQAPWVRFVTPFTLRSPSQFRAEPPPALDGDTWIRDYNETKALGAAVGSTRTPEQTDLGKFWGDQPMLQWSRAWRAISIAQGLSLSENARYFAMLTTAGSDSLIACWDAKYAYAFWRPVTAIRAGGANPALTADSEWIGQVVAPNHPEYPAAHGCFSGSVAYTLMTYFGTDDFEFAVDSNFAGVVRKIRYYASFSGMLDEVKDARVYGGMHFRNSCDKGAIIGKQVSHFMSHHYFRPRH